MDGRPTWTDCDEAGDYVVPNVLSPRDLVSRPDNIDKTVSHTSHTSGYSFLLGIINDSCIISNFYQPFKRVLRSPFFKPWPNWNKNS